MKKLFIAAAMMMMSVATFAQNAVGQLTIQPKVGINIASVTDNDYTDPRYGVAAGAELEYGVSDIVGISAGLMYSMQGFKTKVSRLSTTTKLDYLNIPILANVYVVKGLAVKLGVQPGFKLSSKFKGELSDGSSAEVDVDNTKSFDLSIPVGLSYQYQNVVLDARYNWGVTKWLEDSDSKQSVFQITLGYKFAL